jgi:hypothetical protein
VKTASGEKPHHRNVLLRETSMGSKGQGKRFPRQYGVQERIKPIFLQHCYVTGGSTGLGLALSVLLAQQGADVSIVARNENNLKAAIEKLTVRFDRPRSIQQPRSPNPSRPFASLMTRNSHTTLTP